MPTDRIESQLRRVPTASGVYLFRDVDGEVLYVGKAKSLRPRVRSYFQSGSGDNRMGIRQMAARVPERVIAVAKAVMSRAAEPVVALSVPLVVEARAAANWDDAH